MLALGLLPVSSFADITMMPGGSMSLSTASNSGETKACPTVEQVQNFIYNNKPILAGTPYEAGNVWHATSPIDANTTLHALYGAEIYHNTKRGYEEQISCKYESSRGIITLVLVDSTVTATIKANSAWKIHSPANRFECVSDSCPFKVSHRQ